MKNRWIFSSLVGLAMVVALVLSPRQAAAQLVIPDTFTNLQVLPTDIAKDDLVMRMRGAAQGLGVRCTECHDTDNFASDDIPEKEVARAMIRMVMDINMNHLAPLASGGEAAQVMCVTCHRGAKEPTIDQ